MGRCTTMGFSSLLHSFSLSTLLFLLSLSPLFVSAAKEQNVTVDDTDPRIVYNGDFISGVPINLNFGGSHKLSESPTATATLQFTGTAVYFFSSKWPYSVNTKVQLDGGPSTTIDLIDHSKPLATGGPETTESSVVWSQTGLTNTTHTVVVSRADNYVIVDGFMFTQSLPDDAVLSSSASPSSSASGSKSSSSTPSAAASTSAAAAPSGGSNKTIPIAVGTVIGVLGLAAIVGILLLLMKRRRREPRDQDHQGPQPDSSWEKNAFAPQFAGPSSPLPPSVTSTSALQPAYQSPAPSQVAFNNVSPQTSAYGAYPVPDVPVVTAAAVATAALGRGQEQQQHPYSYANGPPPRDSAYYGSDPDTEYDPYAVDNSNANPYATPAPWSSDAASSSSKLRPNNLNSDTRQANTFSQASGASSSSAGPSPSPQPGYLTSQEEKARVYNQRPLPPAYE